jgi:hypothetical protein
MEMGTRGDEAIDQDIGLGDGVERRTFGIDRLVEKFGERMEHGREAGGFDIWRWRERVESGRGLERNIIRKERGRRGIRWRFFGNILKRQGFRSFRGWYRGLKFDEVGRRKSGGDGWLRHTKVACRRRRDEGVEILG